MKDIRSFVGERERRFIPNQTSGVALRVQGEKARTIEGYGALFNTETVIAGFFREVILPGAFADSVKNDDIRVFFNHDANYILGRTSAGTAKVEENETGLRYTATPPASRADVVESIERKDVTGSSFSFTVEAPDDEEWDYSETKKGMLPLRKIKRATLYETGPVAFPAYENTTVSARAVGAVEEAKQLREAADAAEAAATAATTETATETATTEAPVAETPVAETPAATIAEAPVDPLELERERQQIDMELRELELMELELE